MANEGDGSCCAASIAALAAIAIAASLCSSSAAARSHLRKPPSSTLAVEPTVPKRGNMPLPRPRPSSAAMQGRVATDQNIAPPSTARPRLAPASLTQPTSREGLPPMRPRAVERQVAGRISVAGGVLVLPTVAYLGVPVILDVPELGYVELPEDQYAQLYERLTSTDPGQVHEAIAALRKIKQAEDADVAARQRGSVDTLPEGDVRSADHDPGDLSEPITFRGHSPTHTGRRRALY